MFHVCFLFASGMFLVVTLVYFMYVSSSGSTYIFHVCFVFVSGMFLVLAQLACFMYISCLFLVCFSLWHSYVLFMFIVFFSL